MTDKSGENRDYPYIVSHDQYLSEPWWAILLSGILALAFGIIIFAWPLMVVGLLITFFGAFALFGGALGVIWSLFMIKKVKHWWIVLIEGILGIIIGILVFVWPMSSTIFLVYFIGAWLIVTGITAIAQGSTLRDSLRIVMGILGLFIGIFVLFRPPFYASATLLFFIGFFAVFRGIALIVSSIVLAVVRKRANKASVNEAG